jgi:hypothetical protein
MCPLPLVQVCSVSCWPQSPHPGAT